MNREGMESLDMNKELLMNYRDVLRCCAHALWDHKFHPTAAESHTLIHIDAKATRLHFV